VKRCIQCGQTLTDETRFCFKCGGGNFEPVAEAGGYQQPTYQQPVINTYIQQPGYQTQPVYANNEPVTVGNFMIFFLLMLIPVFNIIYLIMVAVGGPRYKRSLTNFVRAAILWGVIIGVLYGLLMLIFGVALVNLFGGGGYYY
jgi:hypothetical protein